MTEFDSTTPFVVVRDDAAAAGAGRGFGALEGASIAIGNFDGVHRGHRTVITAATARARTVGVPAAVVTFEPHPRRFFRPDAPLFRLTPEPAKLRLLAGTGLDGVILLRFDAALAQLSAQDFISRLLVDRYAISAAVIGFNFHFGRDRAGSPDFLAAEGARRGFAVEIVPPLQDGGRTISSGPIRAALTAGQVREAAELLGYPWFVTASVREGSRRGRALGFPTANMALEADCELRHGIYAVRAGVDGRRHDGVASFGRRPMFDNGAPLLEVHLFDFADELYGSKLDVAFIDWIRPEMKFESVERLIRRMEEDSGLARAALARAGDAFPPLGRI